MAIEQLSSISQIMYKGLLILLFLFIHFFGCSQLDSGRYKGRQNGNPFDLYLKAKNFFEISGFYADHLIVYKGKYSINADTLILIENIKPTRTSYFLIKDSITYLKHYLISDGKVIDYYYKNYVFKDSNEVKEIGLANFSFFGKREKNKK